MFANAYARTHKEALFCPLLAINPTGLTEPNSEPTNALYRDSTCGFDEMFTRK